MKVPESILNKIQKLKALSENAKDINSLSEAEAATLAMNKLLTKYNLSLMDIRDGDGKSVGIGVKRSELIPVRNPYGRLWKERLLMTICRYNYCRMIGQGSRVFLLGTEFNMMIVIDLFNTLQSVYLHSARIALEALKPRLRGGQNTKKYKQKWITSFLSGCSIGLSVKLEESKEKSSTALVICHESAIDKYVSDNLNVYSKPAKQVKKNDSAYTKGFYKGLATDLNKSLK